MGVRRGGSGVNKVREAQNIQFPNMPFLAFRFSRRPDDLTSYRGALKGSGSGAVLLSGNPNPLGSGGQVAAFASSGK